MADIYVSTGGSDSTGTGSSGAPYATPGKAGSVASGGDRILIQGPGTYTLTTTTTNVAGGPLVPPAGSAGSPTRVVGYTATPGDLDAVSDFSNFPTLAAASGAAGRMLQVTNGYCHARNLILDGANQADRCIQVGGAASLIVNVKALNFTQFGFCVQQSEATLRRCWAAAGKSGATAAFYTDAGAAFFGSCRASGNPCTGFQCSGGTPVYEFCLSHANTGSSSDGFVVLGANYARYRNCVARANGRDGIRLDGTYSADGSGAWGCILTENGAYGLRSAVTTWGEWDGDYNAFWSNTSGARSGLPAGAHDATLSGDPFNGASSGDFSLNSTSGAGAACRAAGFPGVFPGGLTAGYLDIGAAQHQDSGGGGSTTYVINQIINRILVGEDY